MRSRSSAILVMLLLIGTTAAAQGPWAKKEWKQWSKEDCKKILEDSPWAQRWARAEPKMAEFSTSQTREGVGAESKLEVFYIIQFRSSLPIRQAIARQAQVQYNYDKMEPKDRAALDKQTDPIINATYDDRIIVFVQYGSNVQQYNSDLRRFWQNYPPGTVPQEAFLNTSSGKKISPLQMVAPRGGEQAFSLIFPRIVDGEPVVKPGDKSFTIEFRSPAVIKQESQTTAVHTDRVYVEFKVEKMMFNGQLSY